MIAGDKIFDLIGNLLQKAFSNEQSFLLFYPFKVC